MTDEPPIESHCARCLRPNPAPEGDYPDDWAVLGSSDFTGIICPDCITPEEQQAMDEADMALDAEVSGLAGKCARCLKSVPYESEVPGEALPDGWRVLDYDADVLLVVCPDCITPSDELIS